MCEYEKSLLSSLAAGTASTEIQQHLRSCAACSESELVWRYLTTMASTENCDSPLPSADLIWWRAQLAKKRRLAARSVAAIEFVQKSAMALFAGFIVIAAVRWGSEVFGSLAVPLPVVLAALVLVAGSAGGMLYAWVQGHSLRVFARQR